MKCHWHPEIESTHVVDAWRPPLLPACDECADGARQSGLLVQQHRGYLFGLPIIVKEDVLDAQFIDA